MVLQVVKLQQQLSLKAVEFYDIKFETIINCNYGK